MQNAYINRIFLLFFAALTLFGGCQKEKEKELVLAQVGTATLTLADLRESFPIEFEQVIRRQQYLDFIKRWIDDEVIYQHAEKVGFAKDSVVARKLAKLSRKLLIEEFLARENGTDAFEPDEMTMNQYYEMHKEDFRRTVAEFKIAHLRVRTAKQASELRAKINRGDFLEIAAANSLDPTPEAYASIGFKKLDGFPSCLTQAIPSTPVNAVTLPIDCPDGVYLVKVLERQEPGTYIPFADTKEEIRSLLVIGRKDKITEARIAKYKEGLNIGYNMDQIPGQIESPKPVNVVKDSVPTESTDPTVSTAPTQETKSPEPTVRKTAKSKRAKPSASPSAATTSRSKPSANESDPALITEPLPPNTADPRPVVEENPNGK